MGEIATAGFVVHAGRAEAIDAARSLAGWLRERGVRTRSLKEEPFDADEEMSVEAFADGLGVVVSVGGDGTLLRAAQLAGPADVPLLGVKVGRLGFLTEVELAQAPAVLTALLQGAAVTEQRTALLAQRLDEPWPAPAWALNEVIVEKRARHRVITLRALIGDDYVTTFSGDGLIVATPTGSTAYSFSARGPIVSPQVDALLLTPVSPHMVFDRSIVLPPDEEVLLEVLPDRLGPRRKGDDRRVDADELAHFRRKHGWKTGLLRTAGCGNADKRQRRDDRQGSLPSEAHFGWREYAGVDRRAARRLAAPDIRLVSS